MLKMGDPGMPSRIPGIKGTENRCMPQLRPIWVVNPDGECPSGVEPEKEIADPQEMKTQEMKKKIVGNFLTRLVPFFERKKLPSKRIIVNIFSFAPLRGAVRKGRNL